MGSVVGEQRGLTCQTSRQRGGRDSRAQHTDGDSR
jgi:hypothetical protein